MKLRIAIFLCLAWLLAACSQGSKTPTAPAQTSTSALPTAVVETTPAPDVQTAAKAFLEAWSNENYEAMYNQLTLLSRDATSLDDFSKNLKEVATTLSLKTADFELRQALIKDPTEAQVAYQITYHTVLVGDIIREATMNLTLQDGSWKVQWEDGMILPELHGGNHLAMDITIPARGNIYDSKGSALAAQSEAVALGIVPGDIESSQEGTLLSQLSDLTGLNSDYIQSLYKYAQPDWYIPVGDVSQQEVADRYDVLSNLGGLLMNSYDTRYYFDAAAPHVTGYVQAIPAESLDTYRREGYRGDEKVGTAGLELWGEDQLAGQRGASLYVVDSQGNKITKLAQRDPQAADSIYTTLDMTFQEQVQKDLEGFTGAIVVMEVNSGKILAMASSPTFDPNLFDTNNYNSGYMLGDEINSGALLDRATQGTYPLGSVFKMVTMAAALQTGAFNTEETYDCGYTYTDLPGFTLYDWTYDKGYPPSGTLNISEALMRSCDIWFYHIGQSMYERGYTEDVSKMARAFGFGSPTGIDELDEAAGNMPNPTDVFAATQMAIGQGEMLVTPLQVVRYIAAIANGGTLYRPQVVDKITDPDGNVVTSFTPEVQGTVPISAENLKVIQDAMKSVVANPRGTAQYQMVGLGVPIYGKTGTASNSGEDPHAWFAGYTAANNPDLPDIAIAVIAENAGEGSDIAAPMFRRVVEEYFYGKPLRLYPWESSFYVTRTPTPEVSETPTP